MRYHLKERAWRLTEDFIVRDDARNAVFEIKGKFFHIGDDLRMFDTYSRQELLHIKQHVLSLLPTYDIYRNGQHWVRVQEKLHLFGERFKVQGDNGMVFHIKGNLVNWNFDITDDRNVLLGQVRRNFSLFHDSYTIDVAPNVDAPFIVALTIVIEMVTQAKDDKD